MKFIPHLPVLSRIPGREYFISLFVIGAALFVTFSVVIYRHYDNSTSLNNEVVRGYETARQARLLVYNLVNMETGVRGYMLTGSPKFLEPYTQTKDAIYRQILTIHNLTPGDMAFHEELKEWSRQAEAFRVLLDKQVASTGHLTQAQLSQSLSTQLTQMNMMRSMIEKTISHRLQILSEQIAKSKQKQHSFLIILISGTVLAISAMLLITSVILGLIVREQRSNVQAKLAEERFRSVMKGINDGVFDYNLIDGSIYFSQALRDMLGYSEAELPDDVYAFQALIHPDDLEATLATFAHYQRREIAKYANVFRVRHKDGNWRWVLSRGVGYWDEQGVLIRLIGTHSDITEHKRRESELEQLNTELETYTYIASHDLRSPLVNMRGFARELDLSIEELKPLLEAVAPKLTEEERQRFHDVLERDVPEALEFIIKAVERMDSLTTAVLDLTRIGKREYVFGMVDVDALMRKCIDVQAYEISQKQITVTTDPLPPIYSDALALEQIFSNLLDNAVKYMQPGRPATIHISATVSTADVIYTVADNGRGIDPQDVKKVFEIFRRARNTDNVRGMGMGMAFVKATVRKLSGMIWLESTLGVGTTFFVRLPRELGKEHAYAQQLNRAV